MAYLNIHKELVTPGTADALVKLCPFGAITWQNGALDIDAGCKMCRICVNRGPRGVVTFEEGEPGPKIDKSAWRGITVFAELQGTGVHKVTLELLGKARELASVISHPVYAVCIGSGITEAARTLLRFGADKVFVYDDPELRYFRPDVYTNILADFVERLKPCVVMAGATNIGRSVAPRAAARFATGITADCTSLAMRENTDLVQTRPAFGGNVMAQIATANTRPQFCTVRYKVFPVPALSAPTGELVIMELPREKLQSPVETRSDEAKPAETDISEADIIVAVGRGVRNKADLSIAQELADLLGGRLACTRPMVESGWFPQKKQIGLSGRTVAAKLLITLGISGSVQFAAGMKGSQFIVAVNSDPNADIFNIAHCGIVGDLYEVVPRLIARIKEAKAHEFQ